jgi:isopentenyl diphosphate isomerase/L-lactate dehydrogenase-like FMN-dependent dehydrogenase
VPEASEFRTIHEIVKAARLKLNQTLWDYVIGGSVTETTLRRNRLAIDSRALRPKVLNDVSDVDTTGTILGQQLKMPVMLAPIGSLQNLVEGGGATAAIAAEEAGIMSMASSVCDPELEDIAAASSAPKIYQLYVRGDADWTDDRVQRTIDAGYKAFCLTVDSAVVSRRERDIAKGVSPTSRPIAGRGSMLAQKGLNWSDVARIKKNFDIPLVIKGINRVDDAIRAVDHGVDVVYISNHGGRQLDQGPGALDLLPDIVQAIKGQAEIIIDGGFYRGTDIVKAIALGANAVGIGRLEAWSLAAGGAPALVQCLHILHAEIYEVLSLCGVTSFAELDESFVETSQPAVSPDVFSAFPLLDVTDQGY